MPEEEQLQALVIEYLKIDETLFDRDLELEELDIDSLTILEFVVAVEDTFDISLDDAQISTCDTIGDVMDLIQLQILREG